MSMNGIEKYSVRVVVDDRYGLKKGEIYEAFDIKSKGAFPDGSLIGIFDRFGEEYAFPAAWFERIGAD